MYFSGGAGLISTAEDYFQFAQMLLDRGRANGRVLLSPTTVDLMIAPHAPDTLPGSTRGGDFGLSVQVMRDPLALGQRVSSGSFGWGGAYGARTNFWIDPKEKLVGVLMIQMQGGSAETRRDFQKRRHAGDRRIAAAVAGLSRLPPARENFEEHALGLLRRDPRRAPP